MCCRSLLTTDVTVRLILGGPNWADSIRGFTRPLFGPNQTLQINNLCIFYKKKIVSFRPKKNKKNVSFVEKNKGICVINDKKKSRICVIHNVTIN